MKTLYLDCQMGAAGDMLTAALWELLPDREGFLGRMNALGLPGVHIETQHVFRCGIGGTHFFEMGELYQSQAPGEGEQADCDK